MNKHELMKRTKQLAVETGHLCLALPNSIANKEYARQLIRCSSSVGANYRAACRAKSKPDFINKLRIVEEELDETMFFLELLAEFNPELKNELRNLYKEANELLSVIIASINTALKNLGATKSSNATKNLKS